MTFWKRLLSKLQRPTPAKTGPNVGLESGDQMNTAAATIIGYRNQGWLDLVRDAGGEVVGFWESRRAG
jgi:hypothetical protein